MVDITTLSIVLVILGAFCLPFFYSHQKKKQQENQMVSSFMTKSKENHLLIHSFELWRRSYMIGLDKDQLKLMYVKFHPQMQVKIVDLKNIKKVNIVNEHRIVGAEKQKVIDKLGLLLIHEDLRLADIYLEFFDAEEKEDLLGEPPLMQKWKNLIEITLNDFQKKSSYNKIDTEPKPLYV
jgi:hypothetical protein